MPIQRKNTALASNLLAFASARRIPYIPELLPICGGVVAAVLVMVQLEYWFTICRSKGKSKFYKFLEPCKHPAYKSGDSWTEEFGFSKKVTSSALDVITTRYRSIQALQQVAQSGRCIFQGKKYLSYTEARSRITWYLRNDELVNSELEQILGDFNPVKKNTEETFSNDPKSVIEELEEIIGQSLREEGVTCASDKRELAQVTKGNLHKCPNVTCASDERSLSYIHKNTTETTQENTAARETKNAATSFSGVVPTEADILIGNELTANQQKSISKFIEAFLKNEGRELNVSAEDAQLFFERELLSNSFKNCKKDFVWKGRSYGNVICESPAKLLTHRVITSNAKKQSDLALAQDQLRVLSATITGCEAQIKRHKDLSTTPELEAINLPAIRSAEKEIAAAKAAKEILLQNHHSNQTEGSAQA